MHIIESGKVLDMFIERYRMEGIFRDIRDKVSVQHFLKGEYIIHEEDEVEYFHFFVDGKAKVSPSSEAGKLAIITFMEPLSLIGDIEYFEGIHYLHSMEAIMDCYLIAIPVQVVEKYLLQNPDFLLKICRLVLNKLRRSSEESAQQLLYSIKKRFIHYLLEHITPGDQVPSIYVKYIDIANRFGTSTRHLRRIIARLEAKDIIRRDGNLVIITDVEALRAEIE